MMDLKHYYFQNIQESEYHHRFYDACMGVDDCSFEVFDAEEAIKKFRELCQPDEDFSCNENRRWFYLVTYYLFKMGYEINEFPRLLARPPLDPNEFTCDDIKNRIIARGGDFNGTVRYETRRILISELNFVLKSNHIGIDTSIEQKFIEISNRQASFNNMSTDEKLAEIDNLIENMLKKNGRFISPDYSSICFDYISNETVISYRKKMHCFRHAADEAITEKNSYSEEQKSFFVDFGLTIVKVIHALTNRQ